MFLIAFSYVYVFSDPSALSKGIGVSIRLSVRQSVRQLVHHLVRTLVHSSVALTFEFNNSEVNLVALSPLRPFRPSLSPQGPI